MEADQETKYTAIIDHLSTVAEGIKVISDFGVSSFSLWYETNIKEIPILDTIQHEKLAT